MEYVAKLSPMMKKFSNFKLASHRIMSFGCAVYDFSLFIRTMTTAVTAAVVTFSFLKMLLIHAV